MKKFFISLLIFLLAITLSSCGELEDLLNNVNPDDLQNIPNIGTKCEVQFIVDGEEYLICSVEAGKTLEEPEEPEKEGSEFLGWYIDELKWDFSYKVMTDMILVARFKNNDNSEEDHVLQLFTMNDLTLYSGETLYLNVWSNSDSFDYGLLVFESDNPNALMIDSNGLITIPNDPDVTNSEYVTVTITYDHEISIQTEILVINVSHMIDGIEAKKPSLTKKVGERVYLKDLYDIMSLEKLNSEFYKCDYLVSDINVLTIENDFTLYMASAGTATLTISPIYKPNFSCQVEFTVVNAETFIDYRISHLSPYDDFSNEINPDGISSFTTDSISYFGVSNYYIKGINNTKWYVETTINIHNVSLNEHFPKFGIFTATISDSTEVKNEIYFFIDSFIGYENNFSWNKFGFVEVNNYNWAWNIGIPDSVARHRDDAYTIDSIITYNTEFKMAVARDEMNFHVFINDIYAYSMTALDALFKDGEGNMISSHVGFYHFSSKVTYSDYFATQDADYVNDKITKIENINWITSFTKDDAN